MAEEPFAAEFIMTAPPAPSKSMSAPRTAVPSAVVLASAPRALVRRSAAELRDPLVDLSVMRPTSCSGATPTSFVTVVAGCAPRPIILPTIVSLNVSKHYTDVTYLPPHEPIAQVAATLA